MDGLQWKTLYFLDDVGVPLFSETPIFRKANLHFCGRYKDRPGPFRFPILGLLYTGKTRMPHSSWSVAGIENIQHIFDGI